MPEAQKHTENSAFLDLKNLFQGRETKVCFSRSFLPKFSLSPLEICGEVTAEGSVSDYSGVLQFQAEITICYGTRCDRCLGELTRTIRISLDRPVTKVSPEEEDEGEVVYAENDVIDLECLAYEGLCENLPLKHLCSEDCKGLCPYCGSDLNEAPCSCKAPPDPRLAGLAEFFHE